MDELLDDLKQQCEQETPENKALFTSVANIESQMQTYEKWIQEVRQEMLEGSKASLPKSADIELKQQVCAAKTELTSQSLVEKEKMESLQKIVSNPSKTESQATDYNDINSLRNTLVTTTLTNLHVLHQYKELLNLVKDNFMTRPRANRVVTPKKPIAVQEVKVIESKTEEAAEPNSGINADIVTPTSVQMGQGSFKTEESKPTCDTDKDAFVQVVPETQELITLRNQVKIQTDMYNEKVQEIKKQNELIERLKRQHENLREQINRVDKENIKLKKKMDQDNLNKQQQYLSAIQDPQQFQYAQNENKGLTSWVSNMFSGAIGNKVIQKKVDVNSGGFFSKKVFGNNMWQQNTNAFSPAPRNVDYRGNTNKRGNSPGKRGNTQVNAYEYSGKAFGNNYEQVRQSQSTDFDFKKKGRHHGMPSQDFSS